LRIAENVSCFTSSANYFGHDLHRAIDNTVPRNSEVMIRWSGFGSIAAGNSSPSANPQAKGTTIPAADVLMGARRACLTSLSSVSIPVSSNSIRMTSCDTASIMAFCCGPRRRPRVAPRARSRRIRKAQAEFRRSAAPLRPVARSAASPRPPDKHLRWSLHWRSPWRARGVQLKG
jgi:hypothetical protein